MIDLHTHLLPAVDDGARTAEQAGDVLARLAADGVTVIACTPHLRASRAGEAPVAEHAARRATLRAVAPAALTLVGGYEIMLDAPGADLGAPGLTLGDSRAVLVEFPHGGAPVAVERELTRLRASGLVPVLAHPERYPNVSRAAVRRWRAAGALMQGDATTLVGSAASAPARGGAATRAAHALLADGLYDLLASDNHGDARRLADARDLLVAHGAGDAAELLTRTNPARLLRDETPLPVPGVRLDAGVAGGLRSWLTARLDRRARPAS